MHLIIRLICIAILFSLPLTGHTSITVGGTRLIYVGSNNEEQISVSNKKGSVPYLIQSWVETEEKTGKKAPFIVTPPLFRLDGGHENSLRVINLSKESLPEDRESVFWLNIKSIPSMEKSDQNRLLIAVKTRIKLFYRPSKINSDEALTAWEKLDFHKDGGVVLIKNPTPYYVSLFALTIGSKKVEHPPMVAPFSSISITGSGNNVAWKAINDFGGVTEEIRKTMP